MGLEFLDPLEDRVQQVSDRLQELTRENAELRARLEVLESELDAAELEGEKRWHREREEVRRRVDALVARLSDLADASEAGETAAG